MFKYKVYITKVGITTVEAKDEAEARNLALMDADNDLLDIKDTAVAYIELIGVQGEDNTGKVK